MADFPEQRARQTIDAMLAAAGWAVQVCKAFHPAASIGIDLWEVPLKSGRCDYLLFVNRKPVGDVEAKEAEIIPPLTEQIRYMAEVERWLSVVDKLEAGVTTHPPTHHPSAAIHPAEGFHRETFLPV